MKILKIFGIVVGIHIFALILIFANPGCSSTTNAPTPADTAAKSEPAAPLSVPNLAPAPAAPPVSFNPEAPAVAATGGGSSGGFRSLPTRPGTPVAVAAVSEPVTDVTPASTYTVVSGDNLSKIAKKTHATTAELAAANGLAVTATLRPGQKLVIPGKPAAAGAASAAHAPASLSPPATAKSVAAEPAAARPPGEVLKHTVKSGETLGAIARKYEVKVADIAVANNIADPAKIKPGQELIIPGWDSKPSSKSGKGAKTSPASQKSGDARTPAAEPAPVTAPATAPVVPTIPVNPVDDNPFKPAPRN